MKELISIVLIIFFIVIPVYSYPDSQIKDCIQRVTENPSVKERIQESSIKNYCDCFLTANIDERKNIRDSGYECAIKNFN